MRHIYRLSKQVEVGRDTVAAKSKVNALVTGSHIGITIAYAVSQLILIFSKSAIQGFRMQSAFFFFGGMADLFLSVMLWFILDNEETATIVVIGERAYAVEDVIKPRNFRLNEDCLEDEQDNMDDQSSTYMPGLSLGISKRMFEQFFTEVEGPDRDWQQSDFDMFGELYRSDLIPESDKTSQFANQGP